MLILFLLGTANSQTVSCKTIECDHQAVTEILDKNGYPAGKLKSVLNKEEPDPMGVRALTLNFKRNLISVLPSAIGKLSELEALHLPLCSLTSLPVEIASLKKLSLQKEV